MHPLKVETDQLVKLRQQGMQGGQQGDGMMQGPEMVVSQNTG